MLTEPQIQEIQHVDAAFFAWPSRFEKIQKILSQLSDTDVISLVELDCYEDLARHLDGFGYDGAFSRRPRLISKDGCGLFWKRSQFSLIRKSRFNYVDPRSQPKKDRCALLVLLQHVETKQPFLFASTHLARDVMDQPPKDSERARQLGELCKRVCVDA